MTIEAVTAVGAPSLVTTPATVSAEVLDSVTLGQMIAARIEGAASLSMLGITGQPVSVSGTGSSGAGAIDPPAELLPYGNGRIPRERLALIGIGQHRLWGPAAQAFVAMRSAAGADGVRLSVTDSYRSYDQQVTLAAQKGLTKNGGWAAVPGTSEHGWGLAIDVDVDSSGMAWLKAHGAEYGWVQLTPREPWHWEYHGV